MKKVEFSLEAASPRQLSTLAVSFTNLELSAAAAMAIEASTPRLSEFGSWGLANLVWAAAEAPRAPEDLERASSYSYKVLEAGSERVGKWWFCRRRRGFGRVFHVILIVFDVLFNVFLMENGRDVAPLAITRWIPIGLPRGRGHAFKVGCLGSAGR